MKRSARKRRSLRKGTGRKTSKKKAASSPPSPARIDPGYARRGHLIVPQEYAKPVLPSKLEDGIKSARAEIQTLLDSLFLEDGSYEVEQISLTVSFSADGKFLGIGVGGATSMTISIRPKRP